ncbi:MAG: trigger factor [Candidatus Gracilibacteria bacterium]|nr:trigger factor [Candidatus Gracilibacteria bacterium]MDD2908373.1 trigger factor [Candidatus Gracilibacteria bacterium]
MQTSKKIINPYTVEITIKENQAEFIKAREQVIIDLSANANIKGFRKGASIPEEILTKHYGDQVIENETIDKLINNLYPKVLKKENIIPTGPASFKELISTNPFEIVLLIEVLPEIEIDEKLAKKIKLKKQVVKVEKKEIEETLKEIGKKFTKFELQENAVVALGDKIMLDTQGFDKKGGKEIPETKVQAFPLVIGSGSFIPGFEEKLIGAKSGDIVEFDITFPEDYHSKDFASRKVFFMSTIFSIEKAVGPEWNEEFIEQLRGVKTDLEGFKKILEDEIKQEKERSARLEDENNLLKELEKTCKIEMGNHLIAHEIDKIYHEHKHNLESQGIDLKHYLEHLKKDEESYKKEAIEPEAIRRLKAELILEKLKNIFPTEVDEEEMTQEIEKMLTQYSSADVKEKLKAKLIPGDDYYEDIKSRIKYKKIIDTFFE